MSGSTIKVAHELLERQARLYPDRIAVIGENEQVTFAELNARANSIAHRILDHNLPVESHIGICVSRSPHLVTALFGVLKSGCAYTPLDSTLPVERLRYIVGDSGLNVIICDEDTALPLSNVTIIDPRRCDPIAQDPNVRVAGSQLAYIIYTSGSTGIPKGVMVEHHSLANFAQAQINAFPVAPGDRFLQFSSFAFDAATSDIVTTVAAGATIVCVNRDTTLSPTLFADFVARYAVDVVTLPPSFLSLLDPGDFPSLKVVVTVGQHCTQRIVDRWADAVRLINGYGPTEATIGTTLGVQERGRKPHIGTAMANTCVYLLDEDGGPVADGDVGEIHIGGAGVGRGYWNRPDLTARIFGRNPFSSDPGARIVRTFDRARFAEDGNLEILGRSDRVIKLHGQRIDLDDIEANLRSQPGIATAAVIFRRGVDYDDRLVAFFVTEAGRDITVDSIRDYLATRVPGYMLPHAFNRMDKLPVLVSGKWDYAELEDLAEKKQINVGISQSGVHNLICELLDINGASLDGSFIAFGGDSISALRLCHFLRSQWDVRMTTATVLGAGSLRDLIGEIDEKITGQDRAM